MSFADALRKARKQRGMSQSQAVACVPYLSVRTLQEWEQGHQQPPLWSQNLLLKQIAERKSSVGAVGKTSRAKLRAKTHNAQAQAQPPTVTPERKGDTQ